MVTATTVLSFAFWLLFIGGLLVVYGALKSAR